MNLEYVNLILQIIGGSFVVIGGIYSFFKWVLPFFKRIRQGLSSRQQHIPKETLKLVLQPRGTWWHMGKSKGEPAMQIACHMYATNIIDKDIIVTGVNLRKPKSDGIVFVKHPSHDIYGSYPILQGFTTELSLDFWLQPPVKKEGEMFKGDIAVLDQFGNKHWVKGVEFRYT